MNDDLYQKSLELHRKFRGKIELKSRVPLKDQHDLSLAYTPGVAEPSRRIAEDPNEVWELTSRGNWVAVVTDGTSVLGLGDIGPAAGLPVMEGKCILFKEFAGIDAFPLVIDSKNVDEIVATVKRVQYSFGAVNLEDISAPRCFEIEERLERELGIPVMHDDQHGTAVVVAAGLMNALKLVGKSFETASFAVSGAGAAGNAIIKMLYAMGARDIVASDRWGIIGPHRELDEYRIGLLKITNQKEMRGELEDAVKGRDVFIGVSGPNILTEEMVRSMNKDAIVFALANPEPEIDPDLAKRAGARIVATGRSDYPNQINNVLAYPGIFKGALETRAPKITEAMKRAAVVALASYVKEPSDSKLLPDALDRNVARVVSDAIKALQ